MDSGPAAGGGPGASSEFLTLDRGVEIPAHTPGPVSIYALVDPLDKTVRYIGQTVDPTSRKSAHRSDWSEHWDEYPQSADSSARRKWVDACRGAGGVRLVVIDSAVEAQSSIVEMTWINAYRKNGGRLYNVGSPAAYDLWTIHEVRTFVAVVLRRCGPTSIRRITTLAWACGHTYADIPAVVSMDGLHVELDPHPISPRRRYDIVFPHGWTIGYYPKSGQ